jgi:hypothetical protein
MKNRLLLIAAILCLECPSTAIAARFDGLNDNCQLAPKDPAEWVQRQSFKFVERGKSYKLIHSATLDGSGSLCLVSGKSAKPVGYKPDWYLDRVERVSDRVFNVQIHDGNGNNAPTIKYRLDLTQPQNPQVKVLKQWVMK